MQCAKHQLYHMSNILTWTTNTTRCAPSPKNGCWAPAGDLTMWTKQAITWIPKKHSDMSFLLFHRVAGLDFMSTYSKYYKIIWTPLYNYLKSCESIHYSMTLSSHIRCADQHFTAEILSQPRLEGRPPRILRMSGWVGHIYEVKVESRQSWHCIKYHQTSSDQRSAFLPFNTQEDLPTQLKSTESQRASTASLLMSCTNSATPRRLPRSHHVLESPVHSSNPPNKKYRSSVNGRFPHGMLLIGFSMISPSWLNILFNQLCWDHTTMFHLPIKIGVKSTILCCFTATLRRPSSSGFSLQSSLRMLKNTWSYSNSFPLQCIK